jgi:hypothetical protein
MVKYLSFRNSSFFPNILFNVNGKAIVRHTPCFFNRENGLLHVQFYVYYYATIACSQRAEETKKLRGFSISSKLTTAKKQLPHCVCTSLLSGSSWPDNLPRVWV